MRDTKELLTEWRRTAAIYTEGAEKLEGSIGDKDCSPGAEARRRAAREARLAAARLHSKAAEIQGLIDEVLWWRNRYPGVDVPRPLNRRHPYAAKRR